MYINTFNEDNLISVFTDKSGASRSPYMNDSVRDALGLKSVPWVRTKQIHEDGIARITKKPDSDCFLSGYDALVTDIPGVCLVTVHADCIPVQLYDSKRRVIAAVHAGWRGTNLEIAKKTVIFMEETYHCRDIKAYVGPGISLCCFEVGPEVVEVFQERYPSCVKENHVDLKEINKIQLEEAGVKDIMISDICTYCNDDFISYRRDGGTDLRMGSIICMK